MSVNPIERIVILGGGTAGWMSAAMLGKLFGNNIAITLVESDEIGTVGVGEATVPVLHMFNRLLGIDENEFVRATEATFKLGIKFENWGKLNHSYFHPFGQYGDNFDIAPFYQYWLRLHLAGIDNSLEQYSLCSVAAANNRFSRPPTQDPRTIWSTYSYAFHFDASLYAKFLRSFAEQRGVKRIEGKLNHVNLDEISGFVKSLKLESGIEVSGDLFIDCSGFRALLIEEALKTGYEDWSHWLPCNSALAVPSESSGTCVPYTRSLAHSAGWQWRIPLQHRTGNGHVFSSNFMGVDKAEQLLLENLDGQVLAEPRLIKFVTGKRKKSWNKNVVAIGLSSGFLEPLESTSIHLVQTALAKLVNWFPSKNFDQQSIDQFNHLHSLEMERIRDFIILHYAATDRNDSEFWNYCRNMTLPDELQRKINVFKSCGRLIELPGDFFKEASWLAVLLGQGVVPKSYDPVAELYDSRKLKELMSGMSAFIRNTVSTMPTQEQYIKNNCAAR
jgi:tryptophan halogenase